MAIYNKTPNIGPKIITNNTDNNWNRNDELRALESLAVQIIAIIRKKHTIKVDRNRIGLWKIVVKNHSDDEKGFQITSVMSPLHSNIAIVACANSPVSIISQKI